MIIDEPHGGQAQQLGPNLTSHEFVAVLTGLRAQLEEHDAGPLSQALQATMMAAELMLKDLDSAFVSLNDAADGFAAMQQQLDRLKRRVGQLEDRELERQGAAV